MPPLRGGLCRAYGPPWWMARDVVRSVNGGVGSMRVFHCMRYDAIGECQEEFDVELPDLPRARETIVGKTLAWWVVASVHHCEGAEPVIKVMFQGDWLRYLSYESEKVGLGGVVLF
jgi:hypothetical protein